MRSISRGWSSARLAEPGPAVLTVALASALTREPPVRADLYVKLSESLEVANLRPRLRDGCEVKIFRLRWGNDFAMLARDDRELHYRLEVWEAELLPKMDGTRTVGDLVVERMEAGGGLDAEPVTDLVVALYGGGFLDPAPIATNELIADRLDPASPGRKKLKRFGKTLQIEWKGADRLVRFCYRNLLRPFFWWPVALVSGLVALAGLAAFIDVAASGRFHIGEHSAPTEAAILLALAFFLTFMHELGHSVVISHYDRKVKSAGFLIYFGSPAFFVEATDSLMLERRQRILQASAGPFTELIIAGVASLVIFAFPEGPARGPALQVRAPELHRDLPEPRPVAGTRRLLDPLRPDPGARSSAAFPSVHPARPVAQDPVARTPHASGVGTRRIRGRRDRVHDLLLL